MLERPFGCDIEGQPCKCPAIAAGCDAAIAAGPVLVLPCFTSSRSSRPPKKEQQIKDVGMGQNPGT